MQERDELFMKKEFEDVVRTITQLGYAVFFISHDKEKTIKLQNQPEYQQIGSSMQSSAVKASVRRWRRKCNA